MPASQFGIAMYSTPSDVAWIPASSAYSSTGMSSIVEQLKTTVKSAAEHGDRFDSIERKTLETLRQICGYLEKNSDRMRYDVYLR